MRADPYPTRVKLMAEYTVTLPLWDCSPTPDKWFGAFDPGMLDLSDDLEKRLSAWNEQFETAMGSEFEWPSPEVELAHIVDGHVLAAELQRELGEATLVLYIDDDEERSRPPRPQPATTRAPDPNIAMGSRTPDGFFAVANSGAEFHPKTQARSSVVDEIRQLSNEAIAQAAQQIDLDGHTLKPGRGPSRVLLRATTGELPLFDRSPLFGLTDDRLDAQALGISDELAERLHQWSAEWSDSPTPLPVDGLVSGHLLAAALQRELGAEIAMLFPEASPSRSQPSPELEALAERIARLPR